jgi:hypothetical protein
MVDLSNPVLNAVDVLAEAGKWIVRVTEGREVSVVSFGIEKAAQSYADGQRSRLRLPLNPAEPA